MTFCTKGLAVFVSLLIFVLINYMKQVMLERSGGGSWLDFGIHFPKKL